MSVISLRVLERFFPNWESSERYSPIGRTLAAMIPFGAQSITSTRHIYKIQVGETGECPDFPTLGHNRYNGKYVGAIGQRRGILQPVPLGRLHGHRARSVFSQLRLVQRDVHHVGRTVGYVDREERFHSLESAITYCGDTESGPAPSGPLFWGCAFRSGAI